MFGHFTLNWNESSLVRTRHHFFTYDQTFTELLFFFHFLSWSVSDSSPSRRSELSLVAGCYHGDLMKLRETELFRSSWLVTIVTTQHVPTVTTRQAPCPHSPGSPWWPTHQLHGAELQVLRYHSNQWTVVTMTTGFTIITSVSRLTAAWSWFLLIMEYS